MQTPALPLFLFVLFAYPCAAQWEMPKPHFSARTVLVVDRPEPLGRGMRFVIHGEYLSLHTASMQCNAADRATFPEQLCETRVTLAGHPVPLLWAFPNQIGCEVPDSVPESGSAELLVIRAGVASDPVQVSLGRMKASVILEGIAYAGMPIWVHVDMSRTVGAVPEYPLWTFPWEFLGHTLEVRRGGKQLPKLAFIKDAPSIGVGVMGIIPPNPTRAGLLPLHVLYDLSAPGLYEVRYTVYREDRPGWAPLRIVDQSGWTTFEVRASTQALRNAAFAQIIRRPPTDRRVLLSEFLPNVLAWRDRRAARLIRTYTHNSDRLVSDYATAALAYYGGPVPRGAVIGD